MKNLIRKILREQFEKGDNLTKSEITLLRILHKAGYDNRTPTQIIIPFLKKLGIEGVEAFSLYELFRNNYKTDGEYSSISTPKRVDVLTKKYKSPNNSARDLVKSKIPFKGSNTHAEYIKGKYVVFSYDWYPIFVFSNNQWYQNSVGYSMTTKKQMSQLRPIGEGNIISLSKNELWDIINEKNN